MPFEPKQLDNTEEEAAKRVIIERSSKNNKYNKQLKWRTGSIEIFQYVTFICHYIYYLIIYRLEVFHKWHDFWFDSDQILLRVWQKI